MIQCPKCNRCLPVAGGKVRCLCGNTFGVSKDDPAKDCEPPTIHRRGKCTHLGEIVGVADCDCTNKPSVYACELHQICLPAMVLTATVAILHDGTRATVRRSCRTCGDHSEAKISDRTASI